MLRNYMARWGTELIVFSLGLIVSWSIIGRTFCRTLRKDGWTVRSVLALTLLISVVSLAHDFAYMPRTPLWPVLDWLLFPHFAAAALATLVTHETNYTGLFIGAAAGLPVSFVYAVAIGAAARLVTRARGQSSWPTPPQLPLTDTPGDPQSFGAANVARVGVRNAVMFVLLTAIPTAYYAGGVSGFGKGYSAALFSRSADAAQTVSILRKLRGGDATAPIGPLELQLDSLIILNRVTRQSYSSLFNLPRLVGVGSPDTIDKLASSAVAYRAEFPSTAPPELKTSIDGALAELATPIHE